MRDTHAYFLGCLIVELLDFRPAKLKDPLLEHPEGQRIVLRPSPESLWADICLLNQKAGNTLTDARTLEIEAKVLVSSIDSLLSAPLLHLLAQHV